MLLIDLYKFDIEHLALWKEPKGTETDGYKVVLLQVSDVRTLDSRLILEKTNAHSTQSQIKWLKINYFWHWAQESSHVS